MAVAPSPDYPAPHGFFMLAMVITIIGGVLNLISLIFGIEKNSKNYPQAKRYAKNTLILTIVNIIFSMLLALLTTDFTVGFQCADPGSSYPRAHGRELYTQQVNHVITLMLVLIFAGCT